MISKNKFLLGFIAVVAFLGLVRLVFPSIAEPTIPEDTETALNQERLDSLDRIALSDSVSVGGQDAIMSGSRFVNADGSLVKHRIFSVRSFKDAFPDSNSVQLVVARKWGVPPVLNRDDAEKRKSELVYVGCNPYYHVDKLNNSIPYLVPRAAVLLQQIGRNFFDSLQIKGIPLHKIIVTSVLRTEEDVQKLRSRNGNATRNSCHLFGTTFDICYNRYLTVEDPDGEPRRKVRNDTLKWILSEVLNDMRKNNRCYIKYEVKQGCFHMTVR